MIKMKRTVAFLVALVGMTLAASAAQAASSVNLVWHSNGLDTITPSISQTVVADIILIGDSVDGVSGVALSIQFDTNELDFVSLLETSGPQSKVGMGNQFAPLNNSNTNVDEGAGLITGFDSATLGAGCLGCTITLGSITFHVTGPIDFDGPNDVTMAVVLGSDGVLDVNNVITVANFGAAEVVGAPEPTTALLLVGGLLGLGYAGRRSTR